MTFLVVSSYKESRNNKPMYGYMLPNLSPNLYKVQSVYNNNVASLSLHEKPRHFFDIIILYNIIIMSEVRVLCLHRYRCMCQK